MFSSYSEFKKKMRELSGELITYLIDLVLAIVTLIGFFYTNGVKSWVSWSCSIITLSLFVVKALVFPTYTSIVRRYRKEKKINAINGSVFTSLYKLNSEKVREVFRHTYGNVPDWNPINYGENVLVYDVHEHIRSILISLTQVIIDIDPQRFSDRNVSVELVYCYPVDDREAAVLPYCEKGKYEKAVDQNQPMGVEISSHQDEGSHQIKQNGRRKPWKLISSGNASGDHESVLKHLSEKDSFFTLLECCGTVFQNDKSKPAEIFRRELVLERLTSMRGEEATKGIADTFFRFDIRDWERSENGLCKGSAIGTVINIRNDNPEDVFVKAILTINTFGECIFEEKEKQKTDDKYEVVDKYGLTCDDYKAVFIERIISTYVKLLEAELAQMYIRHSIREGVRCRQTGRLMKKKAEKAVSDCSTCMITECCSKKREEGQC